MFKFKVRFTDNSILGLTSFSDFYKRAFIELYRDTGIWSEGIIVEQYFESAQNIHDMIFENILLKLSEEKIFGRKKVGEFFEIIFYVGSRLIVVIYSENKPNNERIVESITIGRKPIIF